MDNFVYKGYKYNDISYAIPEEYQQFFNHGSPLGLRNYVLDGHEIQVMFNPTNKSVDDLDYYYAAKAKLLPESEQTDKNIGSLTVLQLNQNDERVKMKTLTMSEMDNSHILDLLVGQIIDMHAKTFGQGPYAEKTTKKALKK